jgi:hypothetical protein
MDVDSVTDILELTRLLVQYPRSMAGCGLLLGGRRTAWAALGRELRWGADTSRSHGPPEHMAG